MEELSERIVALVEYVGAVTLLDYFEGHQSPKQCPPVGHDEYTFDVISTRQAFVPFLDNLLLRQPMQTRRI